MVIFHLMNETTLGTVILLIGGLIGFTAAFNANWKDVWDFDPLCYSDLRFQKINRLLFVIGTTCCLFVNFPSRENWAFSQANWFLFPFIGFFSLLLVWFLMFCAMRFIISTICWVFADNK